MRSSKAIPADELATVHTLQRFAQQEFDFFRIIQGCVEAHADRLQTEYDIGCLGPFPYGPYWVLHVVLQVRSCHGQRDRASPEIVAEVEQRCCVVYQILDVFLVPKFIPEHLGLMMHAVLEL